MYPGCIQFQQLDLPGAGSSAQNDAERRAFSVLALIFGQPAEIKFHLPLVLCSKASLLQLHCDQPLKLSVEKEEVNVKIFAVQLDALRSEERRVGKDVR